MVRWSSKPYTDWMQHMYPRLAAFSWYRYQRDGQGFLFVDLTESDVLNEWTPVRYIPVAEAERIGFLSDEKRAKDIREFDLSAGIIVQFVLRVEEGEAIP